MNTQKNILKQLREALHRTLNDDQALRWIRRAPDLFRLIRVTDALVA